MVYVSRGQTVAVTAGFGMGNFILNALFFAPSFGLNGAIETFVSQAFGKGDYKVCSVYLYKSRLVQTGYYLFCGVLVYNSVAILEALKQDKEVVQYAYKYIMANMVAVYFMGLADGQRRFLNSFGSSTAPFFI